MDRSLGRIWPRATSKLYEEPKKLVAHGLAQTWTEHVGRRQRTMYSITADGRQALAAWLQHPGDGPVLEFEQLLKVFFAENGTRADTLATLAAAQEWARARCEESWVVGRQYLDGHGPFGRLAELQLASRFITDFYRLVGEWSRWAATVVNAWPDDLRQARHDPAVVAETVRRAAAGADRQGQLNSSPW